MRNRPTSKNRYRYAALCGLAIGTAIGTSIAITQRMARHHRMPNLKTWQRALIEKHGEVQGAILAARAQARYEVLYDNCCDFRWSRVEPAQAASGLIQVQAGTKRVRSTGDVHARST